MKKIIVSKFGGTSMGDLRAMKRSALISHERNSKLVVVSATSGTTDKLIEVAKAAASGNTSVCEKTIFAIKERHLGLLNEIHHDKHDSHKEIENLFAELDLIANNLNLLKELTPKAYDHILSLGERLSSLIFTEIMRKEYPQQKIELLDARNMLKTDSNFGKAEPQIAATEAASRNHINLVENIVYVTQGFIASDEQGNTTILGRGGSDYSAALFAEAINADTLEIWTDVAGVATTDPRLCEKAKIISELSYQEASEMAQYGAKILHPATISPAIRKNIPVFVGSTFDKDLPGTWIKSSVEYRPAVRAITKRGSQALLTITTPNMFNAYGFMSEIFDIFGKHRISVDCVTTSEISVAITVDHTTLDNSSFLTDLKNVGTVQVETGYSLVSLIGNEIYKKTDLPKTIFSTMDEANIRMMSLGASSYNFNFLVKEEDSKPCIQKLHTVLIENVNQ